MSNTIVRASINKTPHIDRMVDIDVACLGVRQHYAVPKLLFEAGMLGHFYTDIWCDGALRGILKVVSRRCRLNGLHRLIGRYDPAVPSQRVVSFPWFGAKYKWQTARAIRAGKGDLLQAVYDDAGRAFGTRVVRRWSPGAGLIYCYKGAALEIFQNARELGVSCILEQISQPEAVRRQLLEREHQTWDGWETDIQTPPEGNPFEVREKHEWQLANIVVSGSSFLADKLRQDSVPTAKLRIVPYGVSLDHFPSRVRVKRSGEPLRVLFVGHVALTKGVPYLLEGLRKLGTSAVEARLVGQSVIHSTMIEHYKKTATFIGHVPRNAIKEFYGWADVLVQPSICEGSALTTYEALVSGIPVIATPNAGSQVRDGVDGIVVPVRDSDAVAAAIESFIRQPSLVRSYSLAAVSGRERLGLQTYRYNLVSLIRDTIQSSARS